MAGNERQRELRRRRHRRVKVKKIKVRAARASASEKAELARKLRALTPGAPTIIDSLGLEER